jgi:hypothetical protein
MTMDYNISKKVQLELNSGENMICPACGTKAETPDYFRESVFKTAHLLDLGIKNVASVCIFFYQKK